MKSRFRSAGFLVVSPVQTVLFDMVFPFPSGFALQGFPLGLFSDLRKTPNGRSSRVLKTRIATNSFLFNDPPQQTQVGALHFAVLAQVDWVWRGVWKAPVWGSQKFAAGVTLPVERPPQKNRGILVGG